MSQENTLKNKNRLLFTSILAGLGVLAVCLYMNVGHVNAQSIGVVFDKSSIDLYEGSSDVITYKIKLNKQPAVGQTVHVSPLFPDVNDYYLSGARHGSINEYGRFYCPDGMATRTKVLRVYTNQWIGQYNVFLELKSGNDWYIKAEHRINKSVINVNKSGAQSSSVVFASVANAPHPSENYAYGSQDRFLHNIFNKRPKRITYGKRQLPADDYKHTCIGSIIGSIDFNSKNWNTYQTIRLVAGTDFDFVDSSFDLYHSVSTHYAVKNRDENAKIRINIYDRQYLHEQTSGGHVLVNEGWVDSPTTPSIHVRQKIYNEGLGRNVYPIVNVGEVQTMTLNSINTYCFNQDIEPTSGLGRTMEMRILSDSSVQFVDSTNNPTTRSLEKDIDITKANWDIYSTDNGAVTCVHIEANSLGNGAVTVTSVNGLSVPYNIVRTLSFNVVPLSGLNSPSSIEDAQPTNYDGVQAGDGNPSQDMYAHRLQGDMLVNISNVDSDSFTASWDNSQYNSPGFEVYYWQTDDKANTTTKIDTTKTEVDITGLQAGTNYSVEVHYVVSNQIYYSYTVEVITDQISTVQPDVGSPQNAPLQAEESQPPIPLNAIEDSPQQANENVVSNPLIITPISKSISLTEGGSYGTYTVRLTSKPLDKVYVYVEHDSKKVSIDKDILIFTLENNSVSGPSYNDGGEIILGGPVAGVGASRWDRPITIKVTPKDDSDDIDESIKITHMVKIPTGFGTEETTTYWRNGQWRSYTRIPTIYANPIADGTIIANISDDDQNSGNIPAISISTNNPTVTEGDNITINLAASQASSQDLNICMGIRRDISLPYSLDSNNLEQNNPFRAGTKLYQQRCVTMSAGSTSATTTIATHNDNRHEFSMGIKFDLEKGTNYKLSATNRSLKVSVLDNDAHSRIVSIDDINVEESNFESETMATLTVSLSSSVTAGNPVIVGYRIVDGTAVAGEDYKIPSSLTSGQLLLREAGQTTATIRIPIIPDDDTEERECFTVELLSENIIRASLHGTDSAGTVCIEANTGSTKPEYFATVTPYVGNSYPATPGKVILKEGSGTTNVKLRVAISDGVATPQDVDINLNIGGSALTTDYSTNIPRIVNADIPAIFPNSILTVTIPTGLTYVDVTVPVTIIDDNVVEIEEDLEYIGFGVDYSISDGARTTVYTYINLAKIWIEDNDTATATAKAYTGTYSSSSPSLTYAESAGTVNFKVRVALGAGQTLDNEVPMEISIGDDDYNQLSLNDINIGTATEGTDYQTVADAIEYLEIGSNYIDVNVSLTITDDAIKENNETIIVNAYIYGINKEFTTTITILDND